MKTIVLFLIIFFQGIFIEPSVTSSDELQFKNQLFTCFNLTFHCSDAILPNSNSFRFDAKVRKVIRKYAKEVIYQIGEFILSSNPIKIRSPTSKDCLIAQEVRIRSPAITNLKSFKSNDVVKIRSPSSSDLLGDKNFFHSTVKIRSPTCG